MIKFKGVVGRCKVAVGSKSEREAIILVADNGKQWILRRAGGNAFQDPILDKLVGKTISGNGETHNDILFLKSWMEII